MCYGGCDCAKCSGDPITPTPTKQWVQHISGQGEKWEVFQDGDLKSDWKVYVKRDTGRSGGVHYLPKSEYRLCDPPEVWRNVTEFVQEGDIAGNYDYRRDKHDWEKNIIGVDTSKYRLRKVQLETPHKCGKTLASIVWAFIVEQKVTE